MTMHLVRGMTTTNTRKRKSKMTKGKMDRLVKEHREHNKRMKQMNCHNLQMTFDEYVDYVHGYYKPKNPMSAVNLDWHASGGFRRETENVPSRESNFAPCTVKPRKEYSGERKLVGIATMHKSNMVPVFADEDDKTGSKQATEIAQMRRN